MILLAYTQPGRRGAHSMKRTTTHGEMCTGNMEITQPCLNLFLSQQIVSRLPHKTNKSKQTAGPSALAIRKDTSNVPERQHKSQHTCSNATFIFIWSGELNNTDPSCHKRENCIKAGETTINKSDRGSCRSKRTKLAFLAPWCGGHGAHDRLPSPNAH